MTIIMPYMVMMIMVFEHVHIDNIIPLYGNVHGEMHVHVYVDDIIPLLWYMYTCTHIQYVHVFEMIMYNYTCVYKIECV